MAQKQRGAVGQYSACNDREEAAVDRAERAERELDSIAAAWQTRGATMTGTRPTDREIIELFERLRQGRPVISEVVREFRELFTRNDGTELARLREALEFYADDVRSVLTPDGGKRAREALGK